MKRKAPDSESKSYFGSPSRYLDATRVFDVVSKLPDGKRTVFFSSCVRCVSIIINAFFYTQTQVAIYWLSLTSMYWRI
jgi:hypothetical protein